jgi:hypothetical protein
MNMKAAYPTVLAFVLLGGLVACESEPTGPAGPGRLKVRVTSFLGGANGAAIIELTGPGVSAVSALDGDLFFFSDGNTTRVVICRDRPGTIEFLIDVDDRATPPSGHLIELADGDNRLRPTFAHWLSIEPYEVAVPARNQP